MPNTPPKNLLELLLLDRNIAYKNLSADAKMETADQLSLKEILQPLIKDIAKNLPHRGDDEIDEIKFLDGKYQLKKMQRDVSPNAILTEVDYSGLLKNAEQLGASLQKIAHDHGVDLRNFPEFQGIDFNKDGQTDLREIGCVLLAAAAGTSYGQEYIPEKRNFDTVVSSTLTLQVSGNETNFALRSLSPENLAVVKEVAKQIYGDNTAPYATDNQQADTQFTLSVKDKVAYHK